MAPPTTGSVETYTRADGTKYYRARIRLGDGTRERVDIPEKYAYSEERRALYAAAVQERENERGELLAKKRARIEAKAAAQPTAATTGAETLSKYRERLNVHRVELGQGPGDTSAWKAWITPHLGALPAASVTREQIERFRDVLDSEIAKHRRSNGADGLSSKRASNIWTEVTTTFRAMINAKQRDLRVRADNPCSDVLPPEKGDSRKKTFIYPSEMSAVLASDAPLEWREAYAIGSYLYLRPGELAVLTWADVNFVAGVVHITKAWDERAKEIKPPKTAKGVRDVPIPSALIPLLKRMGDGKQPSDRVVPILLSMSEDVRAPKIRAHLRAADCTRPRLFEDTATTMGVNFRTLRDSGITWLALARVDVMRMQSRAGHENITTTMGYVKLAEDIGGKLGKPFGPLPASLVNGASGQASGQAEVDAQIYRAFECQGRGSNPHALAGRRF